MVQVLLPARLLQEAAACAMLGAALGAVRAFLPARGRAAFVPDVLLSGAVLLACQSYAAGYIDYTAPSLHGDLKTVICFNRVNEAN